MPRANRLHAPGCVFHITARTQGHEPWFTESLRGRIADEIVAAACFAGFRLFAYAIMPNHFHILLRQGSQPLGFMMHRVMHRSALLLRHTHNLQGHVFERRYYSGLCSSPDHVRAAIVYTHLNPWRARLCEDPAHYEWSSHNRYVGGTEADDASSPVAAADGKRFFANCSDDDVQRQYEDHVRFQMSIDALLNGRLRSIQIIPPAFCEAGNKHWIDNYQSALQSIAHPNPMRPIFDVAQTILERLDPHCALELIRSPTRKAALVTRRRNVVVALRAHGYRNGAIARFMGLSPSAVSRISGLAGGVHAVWTMSETASGNK